MLLTDASRKLPGTSTANLHVCFTVTKLDGRRHEGSRDGHARVQGSQKQLGQFNSLQKPLQA